MPENTFAEACVEFSYKGLEKVKAAATSLLHVVDSIGINLKTIGVTFGVGAIIGLAVKNFADMQEIQQDLKDTLEATGNSVNGNIAKFQQLAATIAGLSNQSKKATYDLLQLAMSRGYNPEDAMKLATTATGYAKAMRIGVEEAMTGIIKTHEGVRSELDRLDPAMKKVSSTAAKQQIINEKAAIGWKQLEGATTTINGAMEHLKQTVGAIYSKLGELFAPLVERMIKGLQATVGWMKQLVDTMSEFGFRAGDSFSKVGGFMQAVGEIWTQVSNWIKNRIVDIVFYILNWKQSVQLLASYWAEAMDVIKSRALWLWDNLKVGVNWLQENWKIVWNNIKIYTGAVIDWIGNVLSAKIAVWKQQLVAMYMELINLGNKRVAKEQDELIGIAKHTYDKILHTGPLIGGVSTEELADIVGPNFKKYCDDVAHGIYGEQRDQIKAEIEKARAQFDSLWGHNSVKSKEEMEKWLTQYFGKLDTVGHVGGENKTKGEGHWSGLLEIWKNMQSGATKNATEGIQKQQLAAQNKTNDLLSHPPKTPPPTPAPHSTAQSHNKLTDVLAQRHAAHVAAQQQLKAAFAAKHPHKEAPPHKAANYTNLSRNAPDKTPHRFVFTGSQTTLPQVNPDLVAYKQLQQEHDKWQVAKVKASDQLAFRQLQEQHKIWEVQKAHLREAKTTNQHLGKHSRKANVGIA